MKKGNLVVRIFSYMGKYKYLQFLSLLLSAISGAISIGAYIYVYYVAEELVNARGQYETLNIELIRGYGWKAVLLVSVSFAVYGLALAFSHITAFNTVAKIRIRLIRHLEGIPLGFYNVHPSGRMRKLIEKNSDELEHFIAHQLPDTVQALITPIAFLICIFIFGWQLALICLIPVIIGFLLLATMLGGESEEFLKTYQASAESMGNDVVEYIRGVSVVKVFGQTVFSFKNFSETIDKYRSYMLKYSLSMRKHMSGYIAAVYGIFFVLVPGGIILFNDSGNIVKVILSFVFFAVFTPVVAVMLMRIMDSTYKLMITQNALDSIETEILDAKPLPQISNPKKISNYEVEFKNVQFRYEDGADNAISNLSFVAKQGSVTALVGPSGGGKTTVLSLLARFWDVDKGEIRIGKTDIRELDWADMMDNISFVFQETSLYKMSIADNISFCTPNATREDILNALKLAQGKDIIEKLPYGVDTVIGTKGIYLSGGEMQRVAIARAILKASPIILLDEATAFADSENEYKIQKALNKLVEGKTVFMIAHRLSTITGADQILVMKDGQLVEQGTHDELMKENKIYSEMFNEYQRSASWKIGGREKHA